jgi:acetoin utilization deacetylase AcuC-like enzyme
MTTAVMRQSPRVFTPPENGKVFMSTAYITDTRFAAHSLEGHAEFAGRLLAVQQLLEKHSIPDRTVKFIPDPVTDAQILTVHTDEYLDLLKWTETQRGLQLGPDTYVLPQSFGVARLSTGAAVRGVDAVMKGEAENALVAVRPPGHHAIPSTGMGFCLLGNVAIAARHAQNTFGLKRVLIVDYDVHHGNGTQDIFYEDPSVLFISTHQYPWYPGTGAVSETGKGDGAGFTLNVPLQAGVGNQGYGRVFEEIVWPAARRFKPELILVSAGFDAHWADPLGQMRLDLNGYTTLSKELIKMARELCGGKIVFVMEGGYNLQSLSHAMLNVAYALLDDIEISDPIGPAKGTEPDITELIDKLKKMHQL